MGLPRSTTTRAPRVAGGLLVLALATLAPSAAACSFIVPQPFGHVSWTAEGEVATNRVWDAGRFDLANGTFAPVGLAGMGLAFAASPDGRWFATAQGIYRDDQGAMPGDSCGFFWSLVHALDLRSGEAVLVSERGASALAAGATRLALAQGDEVSLREWGTFAETARLRMPDADEDWANDARSLAFSADGTRLVAVGEGVAAVFDVAEGRLVATLSAERNGRLEAGALTPDGARLALAGERPIDPEGRRTARYVAVRDLASDAALGEWRSEAYAPGSLEPRALAWTREGLAVAATPWRREGDSSPSVVLLLAPDGAEKARWVAPTFDTPALASSPDGSRLAVGIGGALHLLDASLAETARWVLPSGNGPFPEDNETAARRSPFLEAGPVRAASGADAPPASRATGLSAIAPLAAALAAGLRRRGDRSTRE